MRKIHHKQLFRISIVALVTMVSAGMISHAVDFEKTNEKYSQSYFEVRDMLVAEIAGYDKIQDSLKKQLTSLDIRYDHLLYPETYVKHRALTKEADKLKDLLARWQQSSVSTWSGDSISISMGLKNHRHKVAALKNDIKSIDKRLSIN
ncbi:MAG: hypothetical protein HC819_07325 [Cyclobacteriaceae bacterium]|nr:hypothetical protein [Cyclobacteriaceae bacterium]